MPNLSRLFFTRDEWIKWKINVLALGEEADFEALSCPPKLKLAKK
jgi:hypothetical protein